ncbi:MAG: thymidine phosphorylase, partial [Flavobacteriales bacterium]
MTAVELIQKKKEGKSLNENELSWFFDQFNLGAIADFQMSAFLMAVYFQGMDADETFVLTRCFVESGKQFDFPQIEYLVDKHSTGGVGDKITLALMPLLASLGIGSVKLSGRGLGHTGGTADKLEAIPGFQFLDDEADLEQQLSSFGFALSSSSEHIAPLDKKIYLLRDLSATIDAFPLMVASILSKKLVFKSDLIFIDLKVGAGAFLKTEEQAEAFSQKLIETAKRFDRKLVIMLTAMHQPLGQTVGNLNEVLEASDSLKGKVSNDFSALLFDMCAEIYLEKYPNQSKKKALQAIEHAIKSGSAFNLFSDYVNYHGGDNSILEQPANQSYSTFQQLIKAKTSGYISEIDVLKVGELAMKFGAGRQQKSDDILAHVGFYFHKKVGDRVEAGETLFRFDTESRCPSELIFELESLIHLSKNPV